MRPFSYNFRPQTIEDIVGQEELLGPGSFIRQMIEKHTLFSFILYGPPGCGKTSLASIIAQEFPYTSYKMNASVDSKSTLKEVADASRRNEDIILIIDEIHRLKKDTQDFLLPFLENGTITIVGLTTENPYHAINPAIRSRLHIFEIKPLTTKDIEKLLYKALESDKFPYSVEFSNPAIELIAQLSGLEARSALNLLEACAFTYQDKDKILVSDIEKMHWNTNLPLDSDKENYYQLLSALQKSIRGSDVNASLHYLARLLVLGDLESIMRRLTVIAYEDISLGNPPLPARVVAACDAVRQVGMPEAQIILGHIVVDMALSPKSNSSYLAISQAMEDFQKGNYGPIPDNIVNSKIQGGLATYLYPHDFPGDFVEQNYMPDKLKGKLYYVPKENSTYETFLKQRYTVIQKKFDQMNQKDSKK